MSLVLLFHYILLKMFRILLQPSSGSCDLFVDLFHWLNCSIMIEVMAFASLFSSKGCLVLCDCFNKRFSVNILTVVSYVI